MSHLIFFQDYKVIELKVEGFWASAMKKCGFKSDVYSRIFDKDLDLLINL